MPRLPQRRTGLRSFFVQRDEVVQEFFDDFIPLVDSQFSLAIILAYVFFRIEQGQNQTLFCGARKLHKTHSDLTWKAIDSHHLTREGFRELFKTIYGFSIAATVESHIKIAEQIRDRLMHGKAVNNTELIAAIANVISYAEALNKQIYEKRKCVFKPFCVNLRGFTGRMESMDKSTTRWILKGMGFHIN